MKGIVLFFSILFFCTCWSIMVKAEHNSHTSYIGEHGMALLIGPDKELIASHMPLYRPPHDYQIIYQVKSDDSRLKLLNKEELITILPEAFDLTHLVKGNKLKLQIKVFKGHFERGGEFLFKLELSFEKPLYVRKVENILLPEKLISTKVEEFELISVSENTELLIHKISNPPSFDSLSWLTESRKNKELRCKGITVNSTLLRDSIESCTGITTTYLEFRDFSL